MKNAKFQVPTTREILSPRYSPGRARLPKAPALVWNLKFAAGLMLGAWCLGPAFAPVARAQSYSLDWHKIAGGGGTSTGGVYAVSGTIGQHDAGGPMAGGNYSLTGGFWAFYAV